MAGVTNAPFYVKNIRGITSLPWQLFFLIIFIEVFMFANKSVATQPLYDPPFDIEETGRHFDKISINPNGEDWTFSEWIGNNTNQNESHILKFNLRTKQLYRYLTPPGYSYAFPIFSPKGNWIVAVRFPLHDNTYAQFQQALENGEIVMMRADGSDFQVLSAPKGRYATPAMSPSETKIAYWRANTQRPQGSKTVVTNFDVYEYDLITKQSSIFSGPFNYYAAGELQYIDEDSVLLGAIYPSPPPGTLHIDAKKYNYSEVYINKRGEKNLPDPSFMNFKNSTYASVDKNNNYYMYGEPPKRGSSFIRVSTANEIDFWTMPFIQLRDVAADPNGRYMAFMYATGERHAKGVQRAMGMLDLSSGEWKQVRIPSFDSAIPIPVKTAQ